MIGHAFEVGRSVGTGLGFLSARTTRLPVFAWSPRWLCLNFVPLLALPAALGCATVEVVPVERLHAQQFAAGTVPVAHIYADNWGWYLFKYIPVVTGNLNNPGVLRLPTLFTDNVGVEQLVDRVTQESQRRGATIVSDLRTRDRSFYLPFTLFFWLNEFEVSANVSRPETDEDRRASGP